MACKKDHSRIQTIMAILPIDQGGKEDINVLHVLTN